MSGKIHDIHKVCIRTASYDFLRRIIAEQEEPYKSRLKAVYQRAQMYLFGVMDRMQRDFPNNGRAAYRNYLEQLHKRFYPNDRCPKENGGKTI